MPPLWAPTPGELALAALGWLISSSRVQGIALGLLIAWCAS